MRALPTRGAGVHRTASLLVRTSTALAPAFSRHTQCSRKEPCRASTPTRGLPADDMGTARCAVRLSPGQRPGTGLAMQPQVDRRNFRRRHFCVSVAPHHRVSIAAMLLGARAPAVDVPTREAARHAWRVREVHACCRAPPPCVGRRSAFRVRARVGTGDWNWAAAEQETQAAEEPAWSLFGGLGTRAAAGQETEAAEEPASPLFGGLGNQSVRAARSAGEQVLSLAKQVADLWVSTLLVLLPASVPAQTVTQTVYLAMGVVVLWVLRSLLSTLTLVGSLTLAAVCLARWLNFNAAFTESYDEPRGQEGFESSPADQQQRPEPRGRARRQPRSARTAPQRRSADLLDVWYE